MSAYLVVDIDVQDPDQYMQYVAQAPDFIKKHGGQYLVRGGDVEVIEGDWSPARFVIVEFPTRQLAQAFIADVDYQAVADTRRAATKSNLILVDGLDGG